MSGQHFTTRRGFILSAGFGGVSLYALWTAYGAAPSPTALLRATANDHDSSADAMAGMGHGSTGGASGDAFRRDLAAFLERYRLPDGTIHVRRSVLAAPMPATGDTAHDIPMAGMDHGMAEEMVGHSTDGIPEDDHGAEAPMDVLMLAERWYYEPSELRLDVGQTYRFRLMASDISHGASVQFGHGGRMIRLRPNTETTFEAAFQQRGSLLVYCTVYCGQGHDLMQARIDIV